MGIQKMKKSYTLLITIVLITIFLGIELLANNISKEDLGKALFFDVNLSKNRTQSCATCHNPEAAFIDDRDNGVSKMASLGDDLKSLGDRQAPTASYAKFSPDFHPSPERTLHIPGNGCWRGSPFPQRRPSSSSALPSWRSCRPAASPCR